MPPKPRLERIFASAPRDLDAIILLNGKQVDPNFFYISRYRSGLFEGDSLVLFRDGSIELLTSPLEEEAAKENQDYKVHIISGRNDQNLRKTLSSILKGSSKSVGLNFGGISHQDYLRLEKMLRPRKVVDVSNVLSEARLIKDPDELEILSRATQIISSVIDEVPGLVTEGATERALKARIDGLMVERGADSPSFDSIVAFGENSALPHYTAGERVLRVGDNVLIDIGARHNHYCSDITRTFFLGHASAEQRASYETVLDAQRRAIETIREGVKGCVPHLAAAEVINNSGRFAGRFTHSLGHSLGIEVHDGPGLSPKSRQKLLQNMVLTVEPGIYIPGRGGVRIEDDVVVTKDSCRVLTTSPKELTII